MELRYFIASTGMGWVGILGSEAGLLRTTLPQGSPEEARGMLGGGAINAVRSPGSFGGLAERLRAYFDGQKALFQDGLDFSSATTFQRRVWEAARLIPYGETRSYSWVAEQMGLSRAARAAGQALARNPLPIIVPCHRVVGSNGTISGFTGGVGMKRQLLALEASASG